MSTWTVDDIPDLTNVYELQLPRPWAERSESQLLQDALAQIELADRLGFDYAWCVEHHFLEEYSHCSAPEVFLAAAAARTTAIRLGHGIRQVIPRYNHPARTAECLGMLDLISNGRVDFGIGEGATRLELGGLGVRGLSFWRNRYLIAAGSFDGEHAAKLFVWNGVDAPTSLVVPNLERYNPEALFTPEGRGRLLLLSDDGSREVDGVECKRLEDASRKGFRALWFTPGFGG